MAEKISVLRTWAKTRARLASSAPPEPIASVFDIFGADYGALPDTEAAVDESHQPNAGLPEQTIV